MELKFKNGDKMPQLGLGTWLSEKGEVYDAIRAAIKIGYRHFDCAAIYGNEKEIGSAFHDAMDQGDITREEMWITSKLWNSSHQLSGVEPAIQKTLSDLQLDYLDLYLIHWPIAFVPGIAMPENGDQYISLNDTPLSETWEGMEKINTSGLTKHIGVSNFSIKKLKEILNSCNISPEMNQVELHPFLQQSALLQFCTDNNIFMTAYSPLGRPGQSEKQSVVDHPTMKEIAANHNCSEPQVAIAWALARGTAVIPKSVNPTRLKQNFDGLQITLTPQEIHLISDLDRHMRYVDGSFWAVEGSGYTVENLWDE